MFKLSIYLVFVGLMLDTTGHKQANSKQTSNDNNNRTVSRLDSTVVMIIIIISFAIVT